MAPNTPFFRKYFESKKAFIGTSQLNGSPENAMRLESGKNHRTNRFKLVLTKIYNSRAWVEIMSNPMLSYNQSFRPFLHFSVIKVFIVNLLKTKLSNSYFLMSFFRSTLRRLIRQSWRPGVFYGKNDIILIKNW